MRIYDFTPAKGRRADGFGSSGATLSRITTGPRSWQTIALFLEPNGVLGAHKSISDQLLVVVHGSGRVSTGESKPVYVEPGSAVFWRGGEQHETRAGEEGLTAVIIEGEGLAKVITMPLRRG